LVLELLRGDFRNILCGSPSWIFFHQELGTA
jgi:hypothetical protein